MTSEQQSTSVPATSVSDQLIDAYRRTILLLKSIDSTDDERGLRVVRQMSLITALLPTALYLEHVGEPFTLEDLADLNRLDAILEKMTASEGMAFVHASIDITKFLVNKVPLYKSANRGQQEVWAARFYARVMQSVGWGQTPALAFLQVNDLDLAID